MTNTIINEKYPGRVSLHRLDDKIGLSVFNIRGTAYLSSAEARKIAEALEYYAASVEGNHLVAAHVTVVIGDHQDGRG